MPEIKQGKPGLIRVECPEDNCGEVHRVPINVNYTVDVNDEGELEIEVEGVPDMGRMVDHMVYEHGWL